MAAVLTMDPRQDLSAAAALDTALSEDPMQAASGVATASDIAPLELLMEVASGEVSTQVALEEASMAVPPGADSISCGAAESFRRGDS